MYNLNNYFDLNDLIIKIEKLDRKKIVLLIILVGTLIRLLIIGNNLFFEPFAEAKLDAKNFHNLAAILLNTDQEIDINYNLGWAYSYFLKYLYLFFFESNALGAIFSVLAWIVSIFILYKSLVCLKLNILSIYLALIVFAFLPSCIFYTSLTLREPYQLLFINICVYSYLKVSIERNYLFIFFILFSIFILYYLHIVPFITGIIILISALIHPFLNNIKFLKINFLIFITLFIFVIIYWFNYSNEIYDFFYNIQGKRQYHLARGSSYTINFVLENFIDLIFFSLNFLYRFFFYPLPIHVNSLHDLIYMLENILKLLFIFFFLKKILYKKNFKFEILNLAFIYFITVLIWSAGTTNWGTAARHHIPQISILILCFFSIVDFKKTK